MRNFDTQKTALKEYREKVKSGEIKKSERQTPYEKARNNPKSYKFSVYAKCWECSNEQKAEITNCTVVSCSHYNLRPYQK